MQCKDLLEKLTEPSKCISKSFNINITESMMKNIFTTSFLCNREPYLQSFNCKVLHKFVAQEKLLFNMGIKDSPLCKTCKEIDTIEHRFQLCDRTILTAFQTISFFFYLSLFCKSVFFLFILFLDDGYIATRIMPLLFLLLCKLQEHRNPSGRSCRDSFCPFCD